MMISLARAGPTSRTKRVVLATPSGTPRSTSGIQNWASAAAKRKSQASASPQPPPTAWPLTAAIVACSRPSSIVLTRSKSRRNWLLRERNSRRRSSGVVALAWPASAPAENTGGAPVTTTTRVVESSRSSAKALARSVSISSLSELRRSGRLSVTVATAPSRVRITLGPAIRRSSSSGGRGGRHHGVRSTLVGEQALAARAHDLGRAGEAAARAPVRLDGRPHDLGQEALHRAGEPAPHLAVAAHRGGQVGYLAREVLVERGGEEHRLLPAAHQRELAPAPQREGPQPPEPAEQPDPQEARHRRGLHVLAKRGPAVGPAALRPAGDGLGDPGRQDSVDLVEVGLEIVGDDQDGALGRALLAADAGEAAAARLQIGDPDRILVAHPHREAPREGLREPRPRVQRAHAADAVEEQLRVARVLIVDEARDRFAHDRMQRLGELGLDPRGQRSERGGPRAERGGPLLAQLAPRPVGSRGLIARVAG